MLFTAGLESLSKLNVLFNKLVGPVDSVDNRSKGWIYDTVCLQLIFIYKFSVETDWYQLDEVIHD